MTPIITAIEFTELPAEIRDTLARVSICPDFSGCLSNRTYCVHFERNKRCFIVILQLIDGHIAVALGGGKRVLDTLDAISSFMHQEVEV